MQALKCNHLMRFQCQKRRRCLTTTDKRRPNCKPKNKEYLRDRLVINPCYSAKEACKKLSHKTASYRNMDRKRLQQKNNKSPRSTQFTRNANSYKQCMHNWISIMPTNNLFFPKEHSLNRQDKIMYICSSKTNFS